MKLYVIGKDRYYDISVKEWNGEQYSQDMSMDIVTDYIDGHEYDEIEILELVDWLKEYCNENGLVVYVVYGGVVRK